MSDAEPSGAAIALDAELGERFGIAPRELVRVVDSGAYTVLLERVREEGSPLPCEGPPALTADIGCFALDDILAWIEDDKKSGYLLFSYRDHAKAIFLHAGEIVFAQSNQLVDRLGECLLRAGVINVDQLRDAQRILSPQLRLGKIMVERGFLTPRELWNGVRYQVEEIVRSLFSYPGGSVYFWDQEVQPDNVVRLSLPSRRLVAEGLQRREELQKFLKVLEDPAVRLEVVDGVRPDVHGPEQALIEALGGVGDFGSLVERLGFDRESTARSVQLLRLVGAVKLARTQESEGFVSESDLQADDGEQLRATVTRFTKLIGELAGAIARAEGEDGIRERLTEILTDVGARFPELLSEVEIADQGSLDPEPLISRALGLGGDREEQVCAALGELVDYLEFEVVNQPGIQDAEALLRDLSELRASH